MNKYEFWRKHSSGTDYISELNNQLLNKFYNLWMNKYDISDLDEEQKNEQANYIMRKFWSEGTIAVKNIPNTELLVYAPYQVDYYNLYDFPERITLVNKRGVSQKIIPTKVLTVNKDVAVIWAQPNHKPIQQQVKWYVDRIAQVEAVLNTNLQLQKMPFLIGCNEDDKEKLQDVVDRILNNEVVVFTDLSDISKIQALITQVPYIIDKLKQYEVSLENELLTFLGIDNSGSQEKKAQMLVDEVNANNDVINEYGQSITDCINSGFEVVNKLFNRNIKFTPKSVAVDTTEDYNDASIEGNNEDEAMD